MSNYKNVGRGIVFVDEIIPNSNLNLNIFTTYVEWNPKNRPYFPEQNKKSLIPQVWKPFTKVDNTYKNKL
jgi:hypothetical protein